SYGGPRADSQRYHDASWFVGGSEIMRKAEALHKDDNDFIQPGTLYREVLSPEARDRLVSNIIWHLSQGVERSIQERAVKSYLSLVDPDLGSRVAKGLGLAVTPEPTLVG
ncbi:MAG: catalase-related domain-containing protein, partial [Candidatus Aquilonibacter sp.]